MVDWQHKIQALLHDLPHKVLNIVGNDLEIEMLGVKSNDDREFALADWIASAADRLNFPSNESIGRVDFQNQPYLTHPLTGRRFNLRDGRFFPEQIDSEQLELALKQVIEQVPTDIKDDPQKLFLWLWRNWSRAIQETKGNQLKTLWDLIPADPRIPDHSIWAHQSLTSAIAATADDKGIPDPAFLLFTIGPVQTFISTARRTQDLWAGSYLLSYLNWQAVQVIAEAISPDAVIFPNLIGQPLCDHWLKQKGVFTGNIKPEDLILPSLPNRFLAIVPASQGKELAQQAAEAVKTKWREISHTVRVDLEKLFPDQPPQWEQTWHRQIENIFETYWQIYPWRPQGHDIQDIDYKFLDPHRAFLGDRLTKTEKILKIYAQHDQAGGGQHHPNIGAIYSDLYFITEKALGSRKALRNFPQVPEHGDKSTLGGDRAALHDRIDALGLTSDNFDQKSKDRNKISRESIRDFWRELAHKLQKKGRWEIQENGQERLDAIELTKRCAWRSFFKNQAGYETESGQDELRFPSTSSVSTAKFKAEVIAKFNYNDTQKLQDALREWIQSIPAPIRQENTIRKNVIPFLSSITSQNNLITQFLMIDGRLLFPESYQEKIDLESNNQEVQEANKAIQKAVDTLKKFLSTAKEYGIAKPRKYFAVLMMDGDNMGSWISGEKMPMYHQILHPDTNNALKTDTYRENWQSILNHPRLMSPAIHGFISKALGDFSLKLVRHIVEERYPGKLVYAGGDDVLALLPLDSALKVARELRAAFSGEVTTDENGENLTVNFQPHTPEESQVNFQTQDAKSGYVLLQRPNRDRELLATMGCDATASTGITIAHHTQPLDLTLQEVRKAEKIAKSAGRNSFSLTFLKRSGEIMSAGAKWYYPESPDKPESKSLDTIQLLLKFQKYFTDDHISSKFPYILREQAETIAPMEIEDLYAAEIKRLLHRQQGKQKLSKEEEKALAQELAKVVIRANYAHREAGKDEDKSQPQTQLKTFADLLVFTRFLATGEGEE